MIKNKVLLYFSGHVLKSYFKKLLFRTVQAEEGRENNIATCFGVPLVNVLLHGLVISSWALLGFECLVQGKSREYHGIQKPWYDSMEMKHCLVIFTLGCLEALRAGQCVRGWGRRVTWAQEFWAAVCSADQVTH